MLQNIYPTLEHWWTCCKQKSLMMQKLPLLYAGCKKQAFREGSCILFCALQTAFGEHLFISHLVNCSFFSIYRMLFKWSFPTPPLHFKLVEAILEENAPGYFWTEHLVGRQDWKPKFAPCLEKETEKAGIVFNPLRVWTNFESHLGGGSVSVTHCSLLPQTDSLHRLKCL